MDWPRTVASAPQGFLTSVLQGYSRSNMIPVDQLSFEFVMQDEHRAPEEGIYIHGLFMDGAAWSYDDMAIDDQERKTIGAFKRLPSCIFGCQEFGTMFVKSPIINFIPWKDKKVNNEKYRCPIYKTSIRAGTLSTTGHSTNFVLAIEVETLMDPSYWTLKGAAMLTMLND
eukprot:g33606.t1